LIDRFARAQAGYDERHGRDLLDEAIIQAIAETSFISEPLILALRTGEIAVALTATVVPSLVTERNPFAHCDPERRFAPTIPHFRPPSHVSRR
jgi:hypothetical protein